jgi:hypothetical protein
MKPSPIALAGLALALLLSAPAGARAEFIHWMYNWSRSPAQVRADSPGTGYLALSDESLKSAVGDSDVVATNLRAHSTAPAGRPDTFTNKPYALRLYLLDVESGQGKALEFTGRLDGTLTALSTNITNTFTGQTTQQVVLGQHRYTATIGPYSPPGPTGAVNSGSISAHATITVDAILTLPEPGALALACLGGAALGLGGWRRRGAAGA